MGGGGWRLAVDGPWGLSLTKQKLGALKNRHVPEAPGHVHQWAEAGGCVWAFRECISRWRGIHNKIGLGYGRIQGKCCAIP